VVQEGGGEDQHAPLFYAHTIRVAFFFLPYFSHLFYHFFFTAVCYLFVLFFSPFFFLRHAMFDACVVCPYPVFLDIIYWI
jgi:hypothetical protein